MRNHSRRALLAACGNAAMAQVTKPAPDRQGSLVRFGHTDLFVSRLCQGTAFRQVARDPNDATGQRILHRALDLGVNFFDSSNAYGWGGAERALGKAIAGRRDKLVIATKISPFQKPEDGNASIGAALSRDYVMTQVEASLRRLGTDYIDLYLYHNPDHKDYASHCTSAEH